MLRRVSPVETALTYATFLALSIAIHLLVILGTRSEPPRTGDAAARAAPRAEAARPAPAHAPVARERLAHDELSR